MTTVELQPPSPQQLPPPSTAPAGAALVTGVCWSSLALTAMLVVACFVVPTLAVIVAPLVVIVGLASIVLLVVRARMLDAERVSDGGRR